MGRAVPTRPGFYDFDGFVVAVTRDGPWLPNGVALSGEGVWDPALSLPSEPAVLAREVLDALGLAGATAVDDPAALGASLIGRGPGLTPEGDDYLAGLAAVVAASGWASRAAWVAALIGADLRRRTTALSATLLELAARGMGPLPLQELLAGRPGALERLLRLGHTSGRAIATGAAVGLSMVAMRPQTTPPIVV